jgi:CHAD domain-containing protein
MLNKEDVVKTSNTYLKTYKSLELAWNHYQKLFKETRRNPTSKGVHQFRNSIQKLSAVLDLSTRLVKSPAIQKLRTELEEERKQLGPLRNFQVELKLLKAYRKESIYKFIQKKKQRAEKKARESLRGVSLNKQKSCMEEFEKRFIKSNTKKVPQASIEVANPLQNEVLQQEKHFEEILNGESSFDPAKMHELRIVAKRIIYQAQALKKITGGVKINVAKFEEVHERVGEIQDEIVLLKTLDKYLNKKGHSKDTLAVDLKIDLTEEQRHLMDDAEKVLRRNRSPH